MSNCQSARTQRNVRHFSRAYNLHQVRLRTRALLLFALIMLTAGGCARKEKEVIESITDIQKREGVPVTVTKAARMDLAAVERSGGTIEGYNQSVLSASVPATVSSLNVKVGQVVAEDALLMTLKPYTPSSYAIAKANAQTVEKSRERAQALAEQGGVPQEMLDNIETGVIAARENLEAARKSENIIAPFAGTIVEIYQPTNTVVWPGKELIKIASLGRIRVKMSISEAIISRFSPGQQAVIKTGTDTINGSIEKVSLAADESNHTFTVEAVFSNARGKLRPGMYVPVDVVVETRRGAIALPFETVIAENSNKYVYVVSGNSVKKRPVAVGIRGGEYYEILDGLTEGEAAVTSGSSLLNDGSKVKIVQ